MTADPWGLLNQAREVVAAVAESGNKDWELLQSIDAALAEHENPSWHPSATNPNVIETMAQETWERRLWVERMVLNDPKGKIGYWAHIGHSIVNCFDTEEEAKAACLRWYRERK